MPKRVKVGDVKIAVAYLRVSTSTQENGPEVQRVEIERWAAREGVSVASWCQDSGVSGGSNLDDRPGLLDALAALRRCGAGALIVQKRDRLARDAMIALLLEREVARAGARIVTADGTANGDDPSARLQRGILDLFAEYERAVIRARIKGALRLKQSRGEMTGKPRYGYRLATDGVHVEPDPTEQAIIARVLELRERGLSIHGVRRRLAHDGVVGRAGRPLGLTQVYRLLGGRR